MADGLFGGAAFGVYPQMQPRRRLQDVQGSANLPVDVLRGRIAGLFGLVPDVLNFMGRSPMPTETFGETQYDPRPQLPYDTDFYLKNLPLAPTSRAGEVAGQAGSFVPLNPAPLVRAGVAGAQALGPTAARMTEGYLQRQGLMPGVMPEPPSGLLTPEIPAPKPQAPVSDLGFYSAAEQAAMNLQRGKGSGQSFLNDLMKASDVKKDELQYTGLDDFLKDKPNVTRQEVQDFIAGNRVDVQEKMLGGNQAPSQDLLNWMSARNISQPRNPEGWQELSEKLESFAQRDQAQGRLPQTSQRYFTLSEEAGRISEGLDASGSAAGATKYDNYQLPGGENYREILLTLPNQWEKPRAAQIANEAKIKALRQEIHGTSGTDEIRSEISRLHNVNTDLQKQISDAPIYKSSHFDEPNILAHMRVNDRIDADGKKMLLIEEVQSDWHQAGREKGYKTPQLESALKEYELLVIRNANGQKLTPQEMARVKELQPLVSGKSGGVPDAPFKDTWHQLALKRALKEAVDKGYDRIGLTTGKQQAERFSLSKSINDLQYDPKTKTLSAWDHSGNKVVDQADINENQLAEYIGKEGAQKLLAQNPTDTHIKQLFGADLEVGGEGMKKYYDEIYPAFLNKQGKKYGAQVGETRIKTGRGVPGGEPVRYLDITPEMRKAVKKGQPLFAAAPIGALTASEFDYTDPFGNTIADTTR